MPRSLAPIPVGVAITDGKGIITVFFRLAWQALVDSFQISPSLASATSASPDPNAATITTVLLTTTTSGIYRIGSYARKTVIDGVASTLTLTLGWTENGIALTKTFAAMAVDSITSPDSQQWEMLADANTNITFAWAYTSTTPGNMRYLYRLTAELFG